MLIGTGNVREWLALPEGDKTPNAKIFALIGAIEDFADSYTGRKLGAAIYNTDPNYSYFDGDRTRLVYLPQYPVSAVEEVNVDSDRAFGSGTIIPIADIVLYPEDGKLYSEYGYFTRGHRNVKVSYKAGYAPVVGGTHNAAVSTYPCPSDLSQVIIEMVTESIREGVTAIHTVTTADGGYMKSMFAKNSWWKMVLDKYKKVSVF